MEALAIVPRPCRGGAGYREKSGAMTVGMSVKAMMIGSQFDPLGDAYLADPYPFLSEARRAAPVFYSE
jgi:hypothetical protein